GPEHSHYTAALNVAASLSRDRPLQLRPGQSLVSTISEEQPGHLPQLQTAAVLTCVATPPPADAFRPPYCGRSKSVEHRFAELDTHKLRHLRPPAGDVPDIGEIDGQFERTWLDHAAGAPGRYLHPSANMPDYGRELADLVGQAALLLQLDLPEPSKRPLLVHLVQLGIDLHGIVAAGGAFPADGGHSSGRKFPILFAGALLKDQAMLAAAREPFAEDQQTFYVTETAPGRWNNGFGGYDAEDKGIAEWGNQHASNPAGDNKDWSGDANRRCCTANAWVGQVLAARMLGLQPLWHHDALFDYQDRYLQLEPQGSWTRSWSAFNARMWDTYRSQY
ncbi:MAG TPA: hypothetical protein VK348_02640, partial [Planctomycetota bacterium]|nr:hypothetical protein [Planctomycetota bacterium]